MCARKKPNPALVVTLNGGIGLEVDFLIVMPPGTFNVTKGILTLMNSLFNMVMNKLFKVLIIFLQEPSGVILARIFLTK